VPGFAEPPGAEESGAASAGPEGGSGRRAGRTAAGLKRLEGLSELERAIVYAEILGPPKALSD
jgi:3,4-dihydroxy-2-butanone 4-phosphate synthase